MSEDVSKDAHKNFFFKIFRSTAKPDKIIKWIIIGL